MTYRQYIHWLNAQLRDAIETRDEWACDRICDAMTEADREHNAGRTDWPAND